MTALEQIDDLRRFAEGLPRSELEGISLHELYERWRSRNVADEETQAIQEALDSYDRGERGRPVDEFLAEFRQKRRRVGDSMEITE